MKIAISCPIFITNAEHKNYLDLTTKSIFSKNHDIVFIPVENYIAPEFRPIHYFFEHEPLEIIRTEGNEPQSVSKAWNKGISIAADKKCDYVVTINSDIVFKSNAIDRLVDFATSRQEAVVWTASEYADLGGIQDAPEDENYNEHPHFSCFMVKPDFFKYAGKFDENFIPAYVEDGDMHARLALVNQKCYIYGGSRFYHWGSRTIKSDRTLWDKNTQTFPKCQQYFLNKWGHPPVNEINQMKTLYYKNPFNDVRNDITYWPQVGGDTK